jgi:hypothetical protein
MILGEHTLVPVDGMSCEMIALDAEVEDKMGVFGGLFT